MTSSTLINRSFRSGFARGFTSITGVQSRNAYSRHMAVDRQPVSTAWRDVGLAIRKSLDEVEAQDGKTSPKKRRPLKAK